MTAPLAVELLAEAWPHLFGDSEHSCIAAARVGGDVLALLGVDCRPLPCAAWAGNRAACLAMKEQRPLPLDGWSVGIDPDASVDDRDPPPGYSEPNRRSAGWRGHLVITGDRWVLDLAAAQFHRPQRGIFVPGPIYATDVDPARPCGKDLPEGGALLWYPRPELARWRRAPGWRKDQRAITNRLASVVGAEIERRREQVDQ